MPQPEGTIRVRLLGPVDAVIGGEPRPVGGKRRRAVLAALALRCGEVVSADELLSAAWEDEAPVSAANTLQSHVSGLRTVLGSKTAILARPPGYVLDLGTDGTDVQAVERLLRQCEQPASPAQAVGYLQEALALWRGRPLAGMDGLEWFAAHVRRLEQLRLQARGMLAQAQLALGQHAQLIPELESLTRQYPLHEAFWAQLMVALYRAGRQTDALAAYQRVRQILQDEFGIDPGRPLEELHAAVLRHDAGLALPPTTAGLATGPGAAWAVTPAAPALAPAQLPLAVASFTGRRAELAALDRLIPGNGAAAGEAATATQGATATDGARAQTAVVCVVSGPAGVGKTSLAVYWAHRAAARFPHGQLYVNLRGFDPEGAALTPAEAVRGFLDAFGVPPEQIPAQFDAQVALYRSLLAGKRVLVVLDNASDVEQVRPLLPGAPGCLVVATSRNQLTGLVASHGATPLALGLPTADEAREMLTRRLGAGQVSADPAIIEEIITRCDRLPLALAIVAARAATYSRFPLVTLAHDLREAAQSLDAFHTGDTTADVRAVFSWSYHKLGAGAARLFRLLGLHPGPAISVPAAASLAGLPSAQARRLLTELTRVHLLTEHAPGRYSLHDLLRTYATELAHGHDSPSERDAALHRMLDHYLHSAHAAAELLHPQRDIITLAPAEPGVTTETLPDMKAALAWLTAEHRTIVTADMLALRLGYDAHAWQLAWSMSDFLIRQCEWRDQLAMHGIAMRAAERLSQTDALAYAHRGLGLSNARLGQFDEALRQYQRALELFGQLGDHIGQGTTHINIGTLLDARGDHGDYAEALRHSQHAYDQYRAAGYQVGQARALNCIGMCRAKLGDFQQALPYCERALAVMRELGDAMGAAYTMDSLAYIHRGLGDRQQAIACYRQARDMFREAGEPEGEAEALSYIGDIHHDSDDPDAARDAWREALAILTQLNHPDAERLRAKLIS